MKKVIALLNETLDAINTACDGIDVGGEQSRAFVEELRALKEAKRKCRAALRTCKEQTAEIERTLMLTESITSEAHRDEIENNHYGDGGEDCSYCSALKLAREVLKKL